MPSRSRHRIRSGLLAMLLVAPTGCDLLEGDLGAWVVQLAASREPNFRASRSITVLVEPADRALYRRLLPEPFELPEHPLVALRVTDNLDVGPWPLTPYQLGAVSLRCTWRGEEGWHVLAMPENQIVAIWSGRTMGFPKYRAEIRLQEEEGGWIGEVREAGVATLRLEFRADRHAPEPVWQRQGWALGGPTFNLIPPSEGPRVKTIRSDVADPGESSSRSGVVRITLGGAAAWTGLVAAGTEATGHLGEWRGGSSLAPED